MREHIKVGKDLPMYTSRELHSEHLLDVELPIRDPAVRRSCLHLVHYGRDMCLGSIGLV